MKATSRTRPQMSGFASFINTVLFIAHNLNTHTLRRLHRFRGKHFHIFGAKNPHTGFADARALMAEELEKLDWFSGPLQDRTDYLTKSYVPFLLTGPNHDLRRKHIIGRTIQTHARLDDLEALLAKEEDHERALAKFLYRHFAKIEMSEEQVSRHLDFRQTARALTLLPKWIRKTLLRKAHDRVRAFRLETLQRIEAAGESIADSFFDVIWFNSGTLGEYPDIAIETLKKERPDLQPIIRAEVDLKPAERVKTKQLILEIMRIHTKIAHTVYLRDGKQVEVALIATATVDPARYTDPDKIDLDRDFSDSSGFSGSAPNRSCPGERFAPEAMACVLASKIKKGELN